MLPETDVTGAELGNFNWLIERWGADCVLEPERSVKDSVRHAIQLTATEANVFGGVSSLAGAVSHIVGDDSEDPDERRKRIEAEENGESLGTLIGKGIDLIAGAVSKSTAEATTQEPDYSAIIDRQREEILQEVFEEDDYCDEDYDDDEDEGFTMSM